MREMNVILADIVTANGGTVTPPITRNGLLSDWLEAITPTIIQQVFITLNGVDEYFTFQNTKTFPDDFDLSIDAVLPTAATTVTLFGQTASADHYIKVLSTGFVSINIDTSIVTSTVLATKDNKQRRYGVKLVGNDFIFTEDGATIDTVTDAVAAAKTLIINALCLSNGADFFNNTPSDPILTDLTTASNSVAWQLNRALPATTEQSTDGTNLLTYVGAPKTELFTFNQSDGRWRAVDIVVNGDFSGGTTGWIVATDVDFSVVAGVATIIRNGLGDSISQNVEIIAGSYEVTIDMISNTSPNVGFRVGGTGDFALQSPGIVTHDLDATSGSSIAYLIAGGAPQTVKLNSFAINRYIQIA